MKHAKNDRLTRHAGLFLTPVLLIIVLGEVVLGGLLLVGEAERQAGLRGRAPAAETARQPLPGIALAAGGAFLLLVCAQGRRMLSRAAMRAPAAANAPAGAATEHLLPRRVGPGLVMPGFWPSHTAQRRPAGPEFAISSKICYGGANDSRDLKPLNNKQISGDSLA